MDGVRMPVMVPGKRDRSTSVKASADVTGNQRPRHLDVRPAARAPHTSTGCWTFRLVMSASKASVDAAARRQHDAKALSFFLSMMSADALHAAASATLDPPNL
jgi:hypothetical protein